MKRALIVSLIAAHLLVPTFAAANSTEPTLAEVQYQRRDIVEATVAPSETQIEDFWRTYWEYRGRVGTLNDRTVALIEEFNAVAGDLTSDRAAWMVNETLDIETKRAKLKKQYVGKFKDILVPHQVLRWYQTEKKIDAMIRAEMALAIPFANSNRPDLPGRTRTDIRNLREQALNELVKPTQKQEKTFWYRYRQYSQKMVALQDRVAALIEEYTASYDTISQEQALRMAKEAADIDTDRLARLQNVMRGLQSTLSARQMVRFMQVELKFDALVDAELALAIPISK
jgi:hypothetical protein